MLAKTRQTRAELKTGKTGRFLSRISTGIVIEREEGVGVGVGGRGRWRGGRGRWRRGRGRWRGRWRGGSVIGARLAKALERYKFFEIGLVACRVSNEYSDDRYNRTR